MDDAPPSGWIPVGGQPRRITREDEIREIGLSLAADRGDPTPLRIQHVACTRAVANRVMCGAVVPGERRSWLIAIEGRFNSPRPTYPGDPRAGHEWRHSVIALVVDVETGAPTDGGGGNEYPDLAAAGLVITDYSNDQR